MKETTVYSQEELSNIVKKIQKMLDHCSIVTLTGPLGAGKTTLVKELLKQCGVRERITSPTFTYVNMYENDAGMRFYHFDLYRVETLQDFLQAGFQEYLHEPNSIAIIEWPEVVMPLLKDGVCHLELSYHTDPQKRILNLWRKEKEVL